MKLIFAVFIGLALTSCVDLEKAEQLDQINDMNQTLDSIDVVFKEHQMDSLGIITHNASALENRVKTYYVSDTINLSLGRKMDAFKMMRKELSPLGKAISAIKSSLTEERASLKELSDDIEGSNGERRKYDEFLLFEQAKVDQLRALITDYVATKINVLTTYEAHYDELNAFSIRLMNKEE